MSLFCPLVFTSEKSQKVTSVHVSGIFSTQVPTNRKLLKNDNKFYFITVSQVVKFGWGLEF